MKQTTIVIDRGAGSINDVFDALRMPKRPAEIKDPIEAAPVIHGTHGRAWQCDVAKWAQHAPRPDQDSCIGSWVIECPGAHPLWHSYLLTVVHLRPISGMTTAFYLDDATHEIWLHALLPEAPRAVLIEGRATSGGSYVLTPINYASQFIEIRDDLALERVRKAVEDVCFGKLNPDSDFVKDWQARFGDNMFKGRPNPRPPRVVHHP